MARRKKLPQTLHEAALAARIQAAGGDKPKLVADFFGWKPSYVTKVASDFDKMELLAKGWTKERLLDLAQAYEDVARITLSNPSALGRAKQLREIAKIFDEEPSNET